MIKQLWRRWRCDREHHVPRLLYVGHNAIKECRHCCRTLIMNAQELELFKVKVFDVKEAGHAQVAPQEAA